MGMGMGLRLGRGAGVLVGEGVGWRLGRVGVRVEGELRDWVREREKRGKGRKSKTRGRTGAGLEKTWCRVKRAGYRWLEYHCQRIERAELIDH
jgi:hypothetical protein